MSNDLTQVLSLTTSSTCGHIIQLPSPSAASSLIMRVMILEEGKIWLDIQGKEEKDQARTTVIY